MKQVWKLSVKCFCVLLPFIVLGIYMRQHTLSFIDGEGPHYIWNREKTNTSQEKQYRVIILGDSTANAAYVPELLSPDTINLALGGTTPAENYYTLRDWLDHNPAPDICYISFTDGYLQMERFFWTRAMYFHRYSLPQNVELLKAAVSYHEPSILTEHYWLDFIAYEMYLPNKYIAAFMNASFNQRYKSNSEAMASDDLHGGRYIAVGTREYDGTNPITYNEFHVNPLFEEYYKKIIELCVKEGITPRVVRLPLPDNRPFTDNFKMMFNAYYENLQNEYPSLTVDLFPTYPMDRFRDGGHMNSHGANQFSTELKERYPEDFVSSEIDAQQISAIDDAIKMENKIEWILKWIAGRDYTVLFCDNRGVFPTMYEEFQEQWGTENLTLSAVPVEGVGDPADESMPGETVPEENIPKIWGISGDGDGTLSFSVLATKEGLSLQPYGQEPQPWIISSNDALGVAVINNYNPSVVCMKSFRYVDMFPLIQ